MPLESNPNPSSQEVYWGELSPCDHLLHIYEDEGFFLDTLHDFLWAGLQNNESVLVVATSDHILGLDHRLKASGLDPNMARSTDRYVTIEAEQALSHFMVMDWPDEKLFREYVTSLLKKVRRRRNKVRVFGEMVALLWEQGNKAATIRLEHLWNQLMKEDSFSLFCAYPKSGLTNDPQSSLDEICSLHSRLIFEPRPGIA